MTWDYYDIKKEEMLTNENKEALDKITERVKTAFEGIDHDALLSILAPHGRTSYKDKQELVNHLTKVAIERIKKIGSKNWDGD